MELADRDVLAGDGGDAAVGREDAPEVERIGGCDLERGRVAPAADRAQELDRLRQGLLLADDR